MRILDLADALVLTRVVVKFEIPDPKAQIFETDEGQSIHQETQRRLRRDPSERETVRDQQEESPLQTKTRLISMARIAGVDIPDKKRGEISLTYIYGIGRSTAQKILSGAGISFDKKAGEWTDEESSAIRNAITNDVKVEGALRSEVQLNIKRLMDIGCYRGLRHRKGLPVRGQHTKNNSRTRKGKRKTVANKKKATK